MNEIERTIAFAEEYRERLVAYVESGRVQRGETKLNEWETILFALQAQLDGEKESSMCWCKDCYWYRDGEVCCNGDSDWVADYPPEHCSCEYCEPKGVRE